jgi:hypothetical protein
VWPCTQRYTAAYLELAELCFQGIGMPPDAEDGFHWLEMAALEARQPQAYGIWGTKLLQGQVCRRDVPKAKQMLEKGANGL